MICTIQADLASAEILDAIAVLWKEDERGDTDVLQVSCVRRCRRLVVTELRDDELPLVVRQKLQQVANRADSAVKFLFRVQVLRFDINSNDVVLNRKTEVVDSAATREVERA